MKIIITQGASQKGLWPAGRNFCFSAENELYDGALLLQNVYKLAVSAAGEKNTVIAADMFQFDDIKSALSKLPQKPQIINAPFDRGSAGVIASMLKQIQGKKDETVIIIPADISIKSPKAFKEALEEARTAVKKGYSAIIGVSASNAEESSGWMLAGEAKKPPFPVIEMHAAFDTQPSLELRKQKNFFWNTGIYAGKLSVLLEGIKQAAPALIEDDEQVKQEENLEITEEADIIEHQEISFDSAVFEKIEKKAVIELKSKWRNFGLWQSVYAAKEKDGNGNAASGRVSLYKTSNSLVFSSKEHTAVSSIDGMLVVNTDDVLLVCPKDRALDVIKLAGEIKKHYKDTQAASRTVIRPWGFYTCLNRGSNWLTKAITVSPHSKITLQQHKYRSEHWVVLDGEASVFLDGEVTAVEKGGSINIPAGAKHSLRNLTDEPLKIIEVQKGGYISEDDIIRYDEEAEETETV